MWIAGFWRISSSMRIDGVEAARPEVLVVPGVFADGDGEAHAVEFDDLLRTGGQEVALLVEDVVEGQQALVLLEEHVAAVEQDGGVDGGLAGLGPGGQRHACQRRRWTGRAWPRRVRRLLSRQRARKLGFSRKSAGG